jgi:hypothetical protein
MFGITILGDEESKALNAQLKRIESKIDRLILSAGQELERDMAEQDEINNLMSKVQANTDAVQAAQVAMKGFVDITQKLTDELNTAISQDNSAAIKAAADALSTNNDQLLAAIPPMAQAIKANTR